MTWKTVTQMTGNTSDNASRTVPQFKAKTTEHLPVRHLDLRKALQVTPTKASGQIAKHFITKPQQVYTSVGIRD